MNNKFYLLLLTLVCVLLSSCTNKSKIQYTYPEASEDRRDRKMGSVITGYDDDGIKLNEKKKISGIPVNIYLWRAALQTISFMPLASSDIKGGTIITDWYADGFKKKERFKFNIFILGKDLKVSSLKVSAFRQVKSGNGWKTVKANDDMVREIEETIFTKARALRIEASQ